MREKTTEIIKHKKIHNDTKIPEKRLKTNSLNVSIASFIAHMHVKSSNKCQLTSALMAKSCLFAI